MKRSASGAASARTTAAKLIEDLVAANRILAEHGVVDGHGHVSVRHERDPNRYRLSRSLAPQFVAAGDIMEYDLDSNPLDTTGRAMYSSASSTARSTRCGPTSWPSCITTRRVVIPFAASTAPLRPLYHMRAFVGEGVSVFEIRAAAGMTDMLIRDAALGRRGALARTLGQHPAALMRGHGAVVVGADLPLAVGRSIYLELNARLQVQAIALGGAVTYLDPEEVSKVVAVQDYARAWELWKRKALAK